MGGSACSFFLLFRMDCKGPPRERICPPCRKPGSYPGIGKIPWGREWHHSSILAGRIPWTEEQSAGLQRVGHD